MARDYTGNKKYGDRGESRFGGGSRFGGRGSGGNRGGFDRPMYPAVCNDCNADCEVPFRPDGSRPVLCRNCFKQDDFGGGRPERPRFERRSERSEERPRNQADTETQLKMINAKLNKILTMLEEIVVIEEEDLGIENDSIKDEEMPANNEVA